MKRAHRAGAALRSGGFLSILVATNVLAADASPFGRSLNSFVDIFFDWATPLAIIAVSIVGLAALFGFLRLQAAVYAVIGIVIVFGAPQFVVWVRATGGV